MKCCILLRAIAFLADSNKYAKQIESKAKKKKQNKCKPTSNWKGSAYRAWKISRPSCHGCVVRSPRWNPQQLKQFTRGLMNKGVFIHSHARLVFNAKSLRPFTYLSIHVKPSLLLHHLLCQSHTHILAQWRNAFRGKLLENCRKLCSFFCISFTSLFRIQCHNHRIRANWPKNAHNFFRVDNAMVSQKTRHISREQTVQLFAKSHPKIKSIKDVYKKI